MSVDAFVDKELPVGELEVDRRVQRNNISIPKVERMKRRWNPAAVDLITVSRRNDRSYVIIDGMHRWEAYRQLTDNQGTMLCRVFEGLSLSEEAQMFLDLNAGNQPTMMEKFKVRVNGGEERANAIEQMARSYEWHVTHVPGNSNINAVGALERLYDLSAKYEMEPNLVQLTLMVITRAWGHDRNGVVATTLEGIGRVLCEYRATIEVDRLIEALSERKGGPSTLHSEASQFATLRKGRVSMAVAELVVNAYNKGHRVNLLAEWRQRS